MPENNIQIKIRLGDQGRLVIPAKLRKLPFFIVRDSRSRILGIDSLSYITVKSQRHQAAMPKYDANDPVTIPIHQW